MKLLNLGLTDPGGSVGCESGPAFGFVEIKESPFSMSGSQMQGVSGKLGSTLAKISWLVQSLVVFFPTFPSQDHMLKLGHAAVCGWSAYTQGS